MEIFPLRIYLRNHSAIHAWKDMPLLIRSLFDGPDSCMHDAEFFIADPRRCKSHFVLTRAASGQTEQHRADIIVLHHADLVVLVSYRSSKARNLRVTAITAASIETAGFQAYPEATS
jgi:hypothetical protein